jgi:hypothetical protein
MSLDGQAKISPLLPAIAEALAEELEKIAGEKVLFALHIFGEGEDHRAQYVSNADREDVAKALRELLDHWKANRGGDDGPFHLVRKNTH